MQEEFGIHISLRFSFAFGRTKPQEDAQDNKQACMAGINGNYQILTISKSIEQFWRNVMINSFFLSKSSFLKN